MTNPGFVYGVGGALSLMVFRLPLAPQRGFPPAKPRFPLPYMQSARRARRGGHNFFLPARSGFSS